MPGIVREGDKVTCGHTTTGSPTVFINGRKVTRVLADSAIGQITQGGTNPGTVKVKGLPISIPGDPVAGHGEAPHTSPETFEASPNVKAYQHFLLR